MQGTSNAFAYYTQDQENAITIDQELQQLVEFQGAGNYNNTRRYINNHYVSYPLGDYIVSKEFRTDW